MQNICLHPVPLCLLCQSVPVEKILGKIVWEICCIYSPNGAVSKKEPTSQHNGFNEHPALELDLLFASRPTPDGPLSEGIKTVKFVSSLLQPLETCLKTGISEFQPQHTGPKALVLASVFSGF